MLLRASSRSPPKPRYATFSSVSPPSPPRATASWFSRLTFAYAQPLLQLGSQRQINTDDLWDLEPQHRTSAAFSKFKRVFSREKSLQYAIFKAYARDFAWCGVGSAIIEACAVFAPMVLHRVIDLFSVPTALDVDSLVVWVGLFLASRLVNAFAYAHVQFNMQLILLRLTSSLKGLLFEKTMRRSLHSHSEVDVTNLFTADMDSLTWAGSMVNALWVMPIQIAVVMYLLFSVLGVAALAGLGVILGSIFANYVVAKQYNKAFGDVMKFKDTRMKTVKEIFIAIQVVKLNAWEAPFLARIRTTRATEMTAIARYLYLNGLSIFLFWSVPLCVSLASFAVYALVLGKTLTATTVFIAMVLFNAIREPLSQFPEALQAVFQARAALRRMSMYLDADEIRQDCIVREDTKYESDVEIAMDGVRLGWPQPSGQESKALLRDVTFAIRNGDFVVVCGAVGVGKSTLCAAILGELASQQGRVFVRAPSIAYYSQQPWIRNTTIRKNILFGLPFDKTKYDRVIDACGLVKDLTMLPAGDATEIGQRGVNLSGGQKARVSLARACYADADVYILDSPLAAVDAVVQSEIFKKCICGLLEKKTVVLVTHLHEVIESKAVNVKILIENGEAKVTHRASKKPRRAYAELRLKEIISTSSISPMSVDASLGHHMINRGQLVKEEERASGIVSAEVYQAYVDAFGGYKYIAASVFILVGWQGLQVASDIWLSKWTGEEANQDPSSASTNMTVYALLGLGASLFLLLRSLIMAYLGMAAARRLFDDMTESLLHAPLHFFDANPIGRILNRYSEDVSTIDFRLPFAVFRLLVASAVNIFQLLAAVYVIRWAGLLIVPLAWLYMRIGFFYLATFRDVSRLMKSSKSPILSHLSQSQDGVSVLRAYGSVYVEQAISEIFGHNDANNRVWFAQAVINQWFGVRVQMIGFGIVVLVVSTVVVIHEYMTPGLVGLAFMYAVSIDIRLSWWLQSWSSLEAAMVSTERVVAYVNLPREGSGGVGCDMVRASATSFWPKSGAIAFENATFAYKSGGEVVLKGLTFEVKHNEKIGIVGRTGAGKSSLTLALFRVNELVSGRILLDGIDISTVNLQTLRSSMSIIPQIPVLFKRSMRAYMDPFEEYSDADIWTVFEKIGLKNMISALDGKLQHELSENGENFSVGERQMLCLARALLRKSRIVVMDEATASIDQATEQKLQLMIQREFVDATVLTIAHRLTTVLQSDRVMVVSDGRVVEFDTPKRLARLNGGVFRALAKESGCLAVLTKSSY